MCYKLINKNHRPNLLFYPDRTIKLFMYKFYKQIGMSLQKQTLTISDLIFIQQEHNFSNIQIF